MIRRCASITTIRVGTRYGFHTIQHHQPITVVGTTTYHPFVGTSSSGQLRRWLHHQRIILSPTTTTLTLHRNPHDRSFSSTSVDGMTTTTTSTSTIVPKSPVPSSSSSSSSSSTTAANTTIIKKSDNNTSHDGSIDLATIATTNNYNNISNSTNISTTNLSRLLQMSKNEWPLIAMSAATLAVTSSVTLLLPFASGTVIDYTISSGGGDNGAVSPLILASGLFGLSALAGGGVYLRTIWLSRAGNRIVARLKQRLYASILKQESAFLDKQSTGDILSRLTSDAQLVQGMLTTQAVAGLRATVMSIGAGGMLLYTSPVLALVSCATLPPIFIMSQYYGRRLKREQEQVQQLLGEATSIAEQALNHPSTIKLYTAENFETVRYRNAIGTAHSKSVDTAHMQAQLEAGAHISGNAAILGVLGMGGTMVLDGTITAGDLTGFVMYSLLLAGNLSSLTGLYSDLVRSMAASTRILDLIDRTPQIVSIRSMEEEKYLWEDDTNNNNKSSSSKRSTFVDPLLPVVYRDEVDRGQSVIDGSPATVEIKNLSFHYPSRPDIPVLKNFTLTVPSGSVVALVGASGSGKSTIASLLTRLYDVEYGTNDADEPPIMINGKSIRDYDPQDLRQMISVVSQDPVLFRGTIRDNIRYGMWNNVSDEDILNAAYQAHVMDFANHFPNGLDTVIAGPRGMSVSGGQRQRISIARMLANKNAPIYILDEATSALDAQSEHYVQSALQKLFTEHSGKTIISIAHRLSTIRHATTIAVVQDGGIVQTGTFDELSTTDGPFMELMKTQLVGTTQS